MTRTLPLRSTNTVLGMPATLYILLTLLSVSNATGKVTGLDSLPSQASAALESGSTFTASMVKPMGLYFLWMSSSSGISCRQGPHQVAQKLIMTTWPLNWARLMALPSRPDSWKPGAGPDEEAANVADANTATRARPFAMLFKLLRADIMRTLRQRKTVALSSVSMLLVTLVSPNKSESNTRSCTPSEIASQSVGSTR